MWHKNTILRTLSLVDVFYLTCAMRYIALRSIYEHIHSIWSNALLYDDECSVSSNSMQQSGWWKCLWNNLIQNLLLTDVLSVVTDDVEWETAGRRRWLMIKWYQGTNYDEFGKPLALHLVYIYYRVSIPFSDLLFLWLSKLVLNIMTTNIGAIAACGSFK